eukprot:1817770-Amphidinium_carterae.1
MVSLMTRIFEGLLAFPEKTQLLQEKFLAAVQASDIALAHQRGSSTLMKCLSLALRDQLQA